LHPAFPFVGLFSVQKQFVAAVAAVAVVVVVVGVVAVLLSFLKC